MRSSEGVSCRRYSSSVSRSGKVRPSISRWGKEKLNLYGLATAHSPAANCHLVVPRRSKSYSNETANWAMLQHLPLRARHKQSLASLPWIKAANNAVPSTCRNVAATSLSSGGSFCCKDRYTANSLALSTDDLPLAMRNSILREPHTRIDRRRISVCVSMCTALARPLEGSRSMLAGIQLAVAIMLNFLSTNHDKRMHKVGMDASGSWRMTVSP